MGVPGSPVKQIRKKLRLSQTQLAAAIGVSKGHMSEVEAGIASLDEKLKLFLEKLSIDVETVEEKHKAFMSYKRQQYRDEAVRAIQAEADHWEK